MSSPYMRSISVVTPWSWKVGDPIAQLILEKIEDATVIQVKSF